MSQYLGYIQYSILDFFQKTVFNLAHYPEEGNLQTFVMIYCKTYCHNNLYTVDSRYLDLACLDPITYVELLSKFWLFSQYIYCISALCMSNYFYVDTSAISSLNMFFTVFTAAYLELGPWPSKRKKNERCCAAGLLVNENHDRPMINYQYFNFPLCSGNYNQHNQCLKSAFMKSHSRRVGFDTRCSTPSLAIDL